MAANEHIPNALDRELDRLFSSEGGELTPDVRTRIESGIGETLRPVKPLPSMRVTVLRFLLVFVVFSVVKVGLLGTAGLQQMGILRLLSNIVAVLVGGTLLSVSLASQMRPGSLRRISPAGGAALLSVGFVIGAALLVPWQAGEVFVADGWPCFRAGILMAMPVGIAYWFLVRRGRPTSVVAFGGTLGAIAGLLGATVLQVTCTRQETSHLLIWHAGVILVSAIGGTLIGKACDRFGISLTSD